MLYIHTCGTGAIKPALALAISVKNDHKTRFGAHLFLLCQVLNYDFIVVVHGTPAGAGHAGNKLASIN